MNRQSDVTVCFTNWMERFTSGIGSLKYSPHHPETEPFPWTTGFEQQLKDCGDRKKRPYHGLLYNREPRLNKAVLLARLKEQDLLTNTSYSWLGWGGKDREKPSSDEQLFVDSLALGTLREQDKDAFMEIANSSKVSISADENLRSNLAGNINFNHVSDCYFQIVSEAWILNSLVDDATPYLTEKSYKPFISGIPFVTWGQKGIIQALREQGYYTFDRWIDHSYDAMNDDGERLTALMAEIERLNSISSEDWARMLFDMRHILLHNYSNIYSRTRKQKRNSAKFGSFDSTVKGVKGVDWTTF